MNLSKLLIVSALIIAGTQARADRTWSGLGQTPDWHVPENWSDTTVPTTDDAVTVKPTAATTVAITQDAEAKSLSVGNDNVNLALSADLSVTGDLILGSVAAKTNLVDQDDCTVSVGATLKLGGGNSNNARWDIHGTNAVLTANKLYAVTYRGNCRSGLTVRDGATVTITSGIDFGHEGAKDTTPPGTAYLDIRDGGSLTTTNYIFCNSGYGLCDVSNATLTVSNIMKGNGSAAPALGLNYSTVNFWNGARVTIKALTYSEYIACNEQVIQWPGSTVNITTLKLSGTGQGGTGSAVNNRYIVNGGNLTMSSSMVIGSNGQAELLLEGGTSTTSRWIPKPPPPDAGS